MSLHKLILFCMLLLCSQACFAQKRKHHPPFPTGRDLDCKNRHLYTTEQRRNMFPFNETKSIVVISFFNELLDCDDLTGERPGWNDTVQHRLRAIRKWWATLPDTLDYTEVVEVKRLPDNDIDTLSDVLFNIAFRKYKDIETVSGRHSCYLPRNAILFLDADQKLVARIEICFECGGERLWPEDMNIGDMCSETYARIKQLLREAGIQYGVTDGYLDKIINATDEQ